jgi:hypothetical protein
MLLSMACSVAAAARDRAIELAIKRRTDEHLCYMVGGLENEMMAANLAIGHMIATAFN